MKGTEDMPEPQTIEYEQRVKLSQKFVDDVMGILVNQPYVEVNDMIKNIMGSKYILPIGILNEIIQRIAKYPYSVVKNFMEIVETNQGLYFSSVQDTPQPTPVPEPQLDNVPTPEVDNK